MATERVKWAILSNFLSEYPEEWDADKVLEKLESEDFYNSRHDEECPDDEALTVWEPFEDWNTRYLARNMRDIINAVDRALEDNDE